MGAEDRKRSPAPSVAGRCAVTQGRYGEVGNLELVACDPVDGLWVCWFNSDPVPAGAPGAGLPSSARSGAVPGHWSSPLRFAPGRRYDRAHVTQVRRGPDHLEVLARTSDGDVRRWVWTPTVGFVDAGPIATGIVALSAVVEDDAGSLHVLVVTADGRVDHRWADDPADDGVRWASSPVAADDPIVDVSLSRDRDGSLVAALQHADQVVVGPLDGATWIRASGSWVEADLVPWAGKPCLVGLSGRGNVQLATGPQLLEFDSEHRWDHVSVAPSHRDGGRLEFVTTADGRVSHGDWGPELSDPPQLVAIESVVWADDR